MNMEPELGEFELIRRFFLTPAAARRDSGVILGIGDDAALLELPKGTELVASVDTIGVASAASSTLRRGRRCIECPPVSDMFRSRTRGRQGMRCNLFGATAGNYRDEDSCGSSRRGQT